MAAMEMDPMNHLHDVLDRYESGDLGGVGLIQTPTWTDQLPNTPGGFPLANLGGCEPRFSLAGNTYAEQASELLSSLSHARLPPGNALRPRHSLDDRFGGPALGGGRHSLDDGLGGDRWIASAARFDDAPPETKGRFIGAYSPAARKRRIAIFNAKRERRVWTRKVKYDVRKNFADTRMRVKGRFVKKEDEDLLKELIALT